MITSIEQVKSLLLSVLPDDGSLEAIAGIRKQLQEKHGATVREDLLAKAEEELLKEGLIEYGAGASVTRKLRRVSSSDNSELEGFELEAQHAVSQGDLVLDASKTKKKAAKKTARKPATKNKGEHSEVLSYRYDEKRKNNPHVGMVDTHSDGFEEKTEWAYDPHIDPALNFDSGRADIENLIDDALASNDAEQMKAALEQLKQMQSPYLNWAGKAERTSFEVDTVSLHVHERLDPATILAAVQKRIKDAKGKSSPALQPDLFHAPFENLPLRDAIDFYKHDRDWANRLIAGDSLLVMNSLLKKEGMAGQVQMIYIDPPYGIKYDSNFQPFTNKRTVTDRRDEDLTQEPEMIKAFRDTWELGIHSFLSYLRDRLVLASELLNQTGSVFVQISDENLHHVRQISDEILGKENFIGQIVIQKTGGFTRNTLSLTEDYVVWYAKDASKVKYRDIRKHEKFPPAKDKYYRRILLENGDWRFMTKNESSVPSSVEGGRIFRHGPLNSHGPSSNPKKFWFQGKAYECNASRHWTVDPERYMPRVARAGYVFEMGNDVAFKLFWDFNPSKPLGNIWTDTQSGGFNDQIYVVQTTSKVIERCMLMTTDPGDLVFDPTCGSGTTANAAEKWGRRWITCDTSRIATTLAKQRLMTASYDYFELKYPHEGLKGGFIYKTVPHITLKSIANNPDIDEIYERMHPAISSALEELNHVLKEDLPEWEVPFDFPEDWPEAAKKSFEAFHSARIAMQQRMDESIAAHAGQEVLYDQPQVAKNKLRITGPFTVEAVPFATVLGLDEAEQPKEADIAVARSGATSRQNQWRDELLKAGIRGKGGQHIQLLDLEPLPDSKYIQAVGTVKDTGDKVAVSFGPEHAALEQRQVEIVMRDAGDLFPLPKMLVFCAFTFDPEAAKDIDNIKGIAALKVQMNTDLLTEDLKKGRSSNESFWLMGQPDVSVTKLENGQYQVEVQGFDYFDTKTGELKSGGQNNIAMWALDTDYDNRSLFPRQVFFPMAGKKDGWNKLRKDIRAELNEELLEQFHGTVSLPFEAGDNGCIAVKIVDDRGIESLKVIRLDGV